MTTTPLRLPQPPPPVPGVDWQPGDPLYRQGSYRSYFVNVREDTATEECACPDAARWPVPLNHRFELTAGDELGDLIAEVRAARAEVAAQRSLRARFGLRR